MSINKKNKNENNSEGNHDKNKSRMSPTISISMRIDNLWESEEDKCDK